MTSNLQEEKEVHYKKKEDLPQDIQDGLSLIGYSIDWFLECVKWDTEPSMREWYNCVMGNAGKQTKEHKDLAAKIRKSKGHPSLNEYQTDRIKKYLESGLSIRDVVRACKADNFEVSRDTVHRIKKDLAKKVIASEVGNQES